MAGCFASCIELTRSITVHSKAALVVHPDVKLVSLSSVKLVSLSPDLRGNMSPGFGCGRPERCARRTLQVQVTAQCPTTTTAGPGGLARLAWAASDMWAPQNCAGNVRMGIAVLRQGTDRGRVALGAESSRSLADVPEVIGGDTSAAAGGASSRRGAGSGAAWVSARAGPDRPMAPSQKPWLARQAGGPLGGGPRCLLLPRDGKRGQQAWASHVAFCLFVICGRWGRPAGVEPQQRRGVGEVHAECR